MFGTFVFAAPLAFVCFHVAALVIRRRRHSCTPADKPNPEAVHRSSSPSALPVRVPGKIRIDANMGGKST